MKQQKKQAKKDQLEREEAVKEKLREAHKVTSLLNTFGDENVRNDFLNEVNGATVSLIINHQTCFRGKSQKNMSIDILIQSTL